MRAAFFSRVLVAGIALAAIVPWTSADAQFTNVALGQTVTGFGTFGVLRPAPDFSPAALAPFSTLTDGVILPDGTQWQTGVWWDRGGPVAAGTPEVLDTRLEIDLGSTMTLTGFGLSFDNNDSYVLYTRNSLVDSWTAWSEIFCGGCAPGYVYGAAEDIGAPQWRDARYVAVGAVAGDGYYGLSEIELYTQASVVPEPASFALLVSGLLGLGVMARRRRRA